MVMTEKGSKKFEDYIAKSKLDNIISDRSFLSEIVYSLVFDRDQRISLSQCEDLIKEYRENGWKFIILDASKECLVRRLNIRGDEDESIIKHIEHLRMTYRALSYFYDIPLINTESASTESIIESLEEKIHE